MMDEIKLERTKIDDLKHLFTFQLDEEANYLAAFTAQDPADEAAYLAKYAKLLHDPSVNMQTIFVGGRVAGSVSAFQIEGRAEVTYWIDRPFWGKGIATAALSEVLKIETRRPIFGRVAFDNPGSQRVLEKLRFLEGRGRTRLRQRAAGGDRRVHLQTDLVTRAARPGAEHRNRKIRTDNPRIRKPFFCACICNRLVA